MHKLLKDFQPRVLAMVLASFLLGILAADLVGQFFEGNPTPSVTAQTSEAAG